MFRGGVRHCVFARTSVPRGFARTQSPANVTAITDPPAASQCPTDTGATRSAATGELPTSSHHAWLAFHVPCSRWRAACAHARSKACATPVPRAHYFNQWR